MISVKCKKCKKNYKVKDSAAGKAINCECGELVKIPELTEESENEQDEQQQNTSQGHKKINRRYEQPDLTNHKVCSKCKSLCDMSLKICPKCGFNMMGVKYDQTRREEISRNISIKAFNILKYLVPGLIVIFAIWLFNSQLNVLEDVRTLENRISNTIEEEQKKLEIFKKETSSTNTILRFEIDKDSDMSHFLYFKKKEDNTPFSILGNGFFTLRHPGVNIRVKYSNGKKENRHYIEDEKGNLIVLSPKEYEFVKFESLTYKVAY